MRGKAGLVVLFWFLSLSLSLSLASASDTIEVVQSVPLETTLAVPGIRQTQAVWLEMIGGAQKSIDLEQFYVSNQAGEALEPVLNAIGAAARRGVHVRLIADSQFYKTYPDSVDALGKLPGAETRLMDLSAQGGVQHAKFFVVDGKSAFVGSQNFDWRALNHIHEVGLRFSDPQMVSDLELVFSGDWAPLKSAARPLRAPVLDLSHDAIYASPQQLNPAGIPDTLSAVVGLMDSAQTSIQIQVMEYATRSAQAGEGPWRALDDSIRRAAQRGVQVSLLVDVSDLKKAKTDLKKLAAIANVQVRTVTVPAWSGGVIAYARLIHSKYLIIDGTASAWVGSENWSESYFTTTRDVGVVLREPEVIGQLGMIFKQVWGSSYSKPL